MTNDPQLNKLAEVFVIEFRKALIQSDEDFAEVMHGRGRGFSTGAHGTVELTDGLVDAGKMLAKRAIKVFGSTRIHERSIDEVARNIAFVASDEDPALSVAKEIAKGIEEAAITAHRVIRPNRLFRLLGGVREVAVGPVRIASRELLSEELGRQYEHVYLSAPTTEKGSFTVTTGAVATEVSVHLPEVCWDVSLQGMPKMLNLQAIWLMDVAVSFIRLQYDDHPGLFPRLSDIEPHSIRPHQWQVDGLVVGPDGPSIGGGSAPGYYEIDSAMAEKLVSPEVAEAARLIFDPARNSLAERVQQALGWLTRGRQAEEPAERVLLFFTAIEALLTGESSDGPVTDTIARYAGVIWTADTERRAAVFRSLKALYGVRSNIVHRGERAAARMETNDVHYLAWNLLHQVLRRADLSASHSEFLMELKKASFGSEWSRTGPAG